jgi:hypothetical protein
VRRDAESAPGMNAFSAATLRMTTRTAASFRASSNASAGLSRWSVERVQHRGAVQDHIANGVLLPVDCSTDPDLRYPPYKQSGGLA